MAVSEQEAVANFRVMILVAKAGGRTLDADDRHALDSAFHGLHMPVGVTLQTLLNEENNLDAQLRQIQSHEAQEACYHSAYAIAHLHGDGDAAELKVLSQIKSTFKLSDEKTSLMSRLMHDATETVLPMHLNKIDDPAARNAHIKESTLSYAILSAVLGAFPVPGLAIVTDLAVVGFQVKLVRDIGQLFGHQIDTAAAKALLMGVGVGTGARIAISNIAKFVPVFGSAVGAAASFASTYAVGKVATTYFEHDCKADMSTLKDVFTVAHKEGKDQYNQNKDVIAAKQREHQKEIEQLATARKSGAISAEEYETRLHALK